MTTSVFCGFFALTLALAVASPASADDPRSAAVEIGALRESLLHARYSDIAPGARSLLQRTDLSAAERNQTLEILAIAHIANREEREADEVLSTLFERDPDHRMLDRDVSPVVVEAFDRARARSRDVTSVELSHSQRSSASSGPPEISVRITEGADAVDSLRVAFREEGQASFARLDMTRTEPALANARLPVSAQSSSIEVEYFIEALAPSGAALTRLGTDDEPLVLTVEPARRAPAGALRGDEERRRRDDDDATIFESPWFWTVAAVAIGGGIATYVLVGPPSDGPGAGSLGQGSLE